MNEKEGLVTNNLRIISDERGYLREMVLGDDIL